MIRYYFFNVICGFFLISSNINAAVKVVQCEDEDGSITFQSTCPPGHKIVGEKRLSTAAGTPAKKSPSNISAVIYIGGDDCSACEDVKEYMKTRGINTAVKDATSDIELQKELNDLAGSLTVPTTKIGDKVITGYKRNELQAALEAMGYEEPAE